jgi:hypothetical protein
VTTVSSAKISGALKNFMNTKFLVVGAIFSACINIDAATVTWSTLPASTVDVGATINWAAQTSPVSSVQIHFDYSTTGMNGTWIPEAYEWAATPSWANALTPSFAGTYIMRATVSDASSGYTVFYGAIYNTVTVNAPATLAWSLTPASTVSAGSMLLWDVQSNPVPNVQVHFDYSTSGTGGPWTPEAYEWAATPNISNPITAQAGVTYTMRATASDSTTGYTLFYGAIYNTVTVQGAPTPTPTPTPPPSFPVTIDVSQYSSIQAAMAEFTAAGNTTSTTLYFPASGSPYAMGAPISYNNSSRPITFMGDSSSASRITVGGFSSSAIAFTLTGSSVNINHLGFDIANSTVTGLFSISSGSGHQLSDLDVRGNSNITGAESLIALNSVGSVTLNNDIFSNGGGPGGTLISTTGSVNNLMFENSVATFWNNGVLISGPSQNATVSAVSFIDVNTGVWMSGGNSNSNLTVNDSQFDCRGSGAGIQTDSGDPINACVYVNGCAGVTIARDLFLAGAVLGQPTPEAVPSLLIKNSSNCSVVNNMNWADISGTIYVYTSFHFYNNTLIQVQGNLLLESSMGGSGNTINGANGISGNILYKAYSSMMPQIPSSMNIFNTNYP